MEPNKNLWLIVIITFSTFIAFFGNAQSECVPFKSSRIVRSLTPVFPPANSPERLESPAPSPEPPASGKESSSPAPSAKSPASGKEPPSPAPSAKPPTGKESSAESSKPPTEEESSGSGTVNLDDPTSLDSGKGSPDLKSVCDQTDFPPLCLSSVNPLLKGKTSDPLSILELSIQASIQATKAAMTAVSNLTESDCKELYDDALTNFDEASNAVKSHDMDTVNSKLSAALTDYSTCNDGFEESGESNPLGDLGDRLMQMASNCLAVSTLVK